jgi:hypothetical protein
VTPQRVTAVSPSVTALVGDVAPYVKPAPRAAVQQGGGGRSQGANAQRKRAARDGQPAGAGQGRGRGRGNGGGSTDVAPATPRRDRSGRPAESKAHAPKQGAGHSRGAQSSGRSAGRPLARARPSSRSAWAASCRRRAATVARRADARRA